MSKQCRSDGCENPTGRHGARGLCPNHYQKAKRDGNLEDFSGVQIFPSMNVRFWSKVDKSGECWEWQAARSDAGYGKFGVILDGRRVTVYAHRWAYEDLVGLIPAGLQIDHLCRNRGCVNPAHLEPVTPQINLLRGMAPVAIGIRVNHCKHGHEWTPENSYIRRDSNTRQCRACHRIRQARRKRMAA